MSEQRTWRPSDGRRRRRRCSVRRTAALAGWIALMGTCAANLVAAPACMCLMDGGCALQGDGSLISYGAAPRAIAFACLTSCAVLLRRRGAAAAAFRRVADACELYAPAPAADGRRCARLRAAYTALCLSATVPVHLLRVCLLLAHRSHPAVVAFFAFTYAQNVAMCLLETRFVVLCYALRQKFGHVNRDLERLAAAVDGPAAPEPEPGPGTGPGRVVYRGDFYGPPRPAATANAVEIMRVRHRLVRDAVGELVRLFGVPMAMSLSALGIVGLFDIYHEVFGVAGAATRWPVFIYLWMVQYFIRFYAIVATAHRMTKQALKSKVLIADINNRYLDDDTKEELKLFFSQVSSCSFEFTACDLFTLNMHLITSAIAAGTTFLVILLQLDL